MAARKPSNHRPVLERRLLFEGEIFDAYDGVDWYCRVYVRGEHADHVFRLEHMGHNVAVHRHAIDDRGNYIIEDDDTVARIEYCDPAHVEVGPLSSARPSL